MVARGDNRRLLRVADSIRKELARLLVREVNDPKLAWVTITEVKPSADLKHARVFFVATGVEDSLPVERGLKKAAPFLQRQLSRSLGLRFTPVLAFHRDESFDQGQRIDGLLRETGAERDAQQAVEGDAPKLARWIAESTKILVATHHNPDGDAIGTLLGMGRVLFLLGMKPVVYCPDGIPKVFHFLPGVDEVVSKLDPQAKFETSILLDTADVELFPQGFPDQSRRGRLVVVDHHLQHGKFGDLVIRREAAAVGEIINDLIKELVWPLDKGVAQCLYASIVSDTGSFRYSSTTPATHRAAAELISAGAEPWTVATALYESFALARQYLLARVLGTLEVSADGRLAEMYCTPEMLAQTGTTMADLDGMINLGRSVEGVEISALVRLDPDGQIKVSFRSKGRVDVAALASRFGGGGHRNAAGCSLKGMTLEAAIQKVAEVAKRHFDESADLPANGGDLY